MIVNAVPSHHARHGLFSHGKRSAKAAALVGTLQIDQFNRSYQPEELVGKIVCVVANLPPREFGKGLASNGMVLYSQGGKRENTAIELPPDVAPGSKVK